MNQEVDAVAGVLKRALARNADQAPGAEGLLERVETGVRRQRRRRRTGAVGAVMLAALAIPLGVVWVSGQGDRQVVATDPGWRWESYGGIEVQVPEQWAWGTTGSPPCRQSPGAKPYVGRPGPVLAIGCVGEEENGDRWMKVPPLASRADYLWFSDSRDPKIVNHDGGWVEETRDLAGVALTVLTDDDALRARLFDSARAVNDRDHHGCAPDHPLVDDADWRPGPEGLETVGEVESVSICRYTIFRENKHTSPATHERTQLGRAPLLSSGRLTGDLAQRLVADILVAPEGTGPNEPEKCSWKGARDETVVLDVRGAARDKQVHFVYSTCDGIGTDDGVTLRQVTPDRVRTVLAGQNKPLILAAPVAHWLYPRSGN